MEKVINSSGSHGHISCRSPVSKIHVATYTKQLLDEVEHDIMNYQNRGQTRGFDNS